MTTLHRRRRSFDRFIDRPFVNNDAPTKYLLSDAETSRPMRQHHSFALIGDVHGPAVIAALHKSGRPSAVRRLVVAIIVDAIKGHAVRTIAHVRKEVLERMPPTVADANTARAVSTEVAVPRVIATLEHAVPRSELNGLRHIVRGVRLPRLTPSIGFATTTRLRVPISQIVDCYAAFSPAIAFTECAQWMRRVSLKSYHNEVRVALTGNHFCWGHGSILSDLAVVERVQ